MSTNRPQADQPGARGGGRLRTGGGTSWRAVIEDTQSRRPFIAAWGPGTEFGAPRVSDREIYWYGYFRNPEGAVIGDELAAARDRFAGWSPWIRDIVAAAGARRPATRCRWPDPARTVHPGRPVRRELDGAPDER